MKKSDATSPFSHSFMPSAASSGGKMTLSLSISSLFLVEFTAAADETRVQLAMRHSFILLSLFFEAEVKRLSKINGL